MVISKEAWKETASILESLNEEQASLDMDNY